MGNSAGRLAFGIIGGVIGAYFGQPGLGFMAGSLIGGLVFPEAGPALVGQRLDNLFVSSSANGNPIPIGAGTFRMPAQVIDATEIVEEEETQDVGGKGMGGGGTITTYKYFGNLFISFGEPSKRSIKGGSAVGILKFFADGKLVFDDSPSGLDMSTEAFLSQFLKGATIGDGFTYRFYTGSESQQPDPFFENLRGVGNVPAYRGQVCLALEHWPLENYGNRIPVMTAVIAYKGTATDEHRQETSLPNRTSASGWVGVNWDLGLAYSTNDQGIGPDELSVIDLTTLTEIRRSDDWTALGRPDGEGDVKSLVVAQHSGRTFGRAVAVGPAFGTNGSAIISIDPGSLDCIGRHGGDSAGVGTSGPTTVDGTGQIGDRGGGFCISDGIPLFDPSEAALLDPWLTHAYIANGPDLIVLRVNAAAHIGLGLVNPPGNLQWISGDSSQPRIGVPAGAGDWAYQCPGRLLTGATEAFGITFYVDSSNRAMLFRHETNQVAVYDPATKGSAGMFSTVINSDIGLTSNTDEIAAMFPDRTDNTVIVIASINALADNHPRIMKFDMDSGDKIWDTGELSDRVCPNSILNGAANVAWNQTRVVGPELCLASGSSTYSLNTNTGEVSGLTAGPVGWSPVDSFAGDTSTRSVLASNSLVQTGLQQLFCGRLAGEGESLGQLNRDIADRIGYEVSTTVDLDFTALDATTVPGWGINTQMEGVVAIRPMMQAYNYEIIEVDHKAVGTFIDKASSKTFDETEIIPQGPLQTAIGEERIQDTEIPARVTVLYADPSLDYQPGAQREQRIFFPSPTMRAESEVDINLPIAMNANEGREIAERLLYRGWVERSTISWKAPWEFVNVTPGDVVTLTIGGSTFTVRITERKVGADNTIEFSGVTHTSTIHTPSSIPAGTDAGSNIDQGIGAGSIANLKFLDQAPLLRDQDNSEFELPLYYGCWVRPGFVSSTIYKQETAGSWEAIDRCVREIVFGFTNTALPAPTNGAFFTDRDSTLEVTILEGDESMLTTQSDAQWRENGLVFLVGSEVISVKTVSVDADTNRYTFSDMFRGMLGTEAAVGTHTAGEDFFLLSSSHLMHLAEPASNLSTTNFYRTATDAQAFELAPIVPHLNTGRALKPFAVAELAAADNAGDIDITWEPRSRLTSNLREGAFAYLESEPEETYEIDILRNGDLIRTLTATTSAVTYTSAQQTIDFAGGAPTISIQVYKTHPVVGRGYVSTLSYTGTGGAGVTRPSIVGTTTTHAKSSSTLNLETFNVTPAAGAGTTMLVLYIAHNSITASGPSDDMRFLDMQGDSFVRFAGADMVHLDAHPIFDVSLGNFTGLGDVFYMIDPGTALGAIEVQWPDGLTAESFVMSAFTVQNVNPTIPFGTARNHYTRAHQTSADFPITWPSTFGPQNNDEGPQFISWVKADSNPTLGLGFSTQQDPRKMEDFKVAPGSGLTAVDFESSTGTTSGNTAACGYRLYSMDLEGEAGDVIISEYTIEEDNSSQPRTSLELLIEVNGV